MASKDTKDIPLGHYSNLPDEVLFKVLKESGNPATMGVDRRTRSIVGGECEKQTYGGLKCESMNKICDTYCREYTGSAIMNEVDSLLASPMYKLGIEFDINIIARSHTGFDVLTFYLRVKKSADRSDRIILLGVSSLTYFEHLMLAAGSTSDMKTVNNRDIILEGYDMVSKVVLKVSQEYTISIPSVRLITKSYINNRFTWSKFFERAFEIYNPSSSYTFTPFSAPGGENGADGFLAMCYDIFANKPFALNCKRLKIIILSREGGLPMRMEVKLAEGANIASVTNMDEFADILRVFVDTDNELLLSDYLSYKKKYSTEDGELETFLKYVWTYKMIIHDMSIIWKDPRPSAESTETEFSLAR